VAVAAPLLIAVVGPTASGKSALGLALAREYSGEIVSCDSLQVYRGLDVGSAKATAEERAAVPHHLLDVVDPDQDFSAADYARLARVAVADVVARGRLPLVVGGTGLYLRALLRGLFAGPARDPQLRARLAALGERFGDGRLHRLLRHVDPAAAARIEARDRVRVIRALEVFFRSGRPLSRHFEAGAEPLTGVDVRVLGLSPPREQLRAAVMARTDAMFARGLLAEVEGLLSRYPETLRPLRAIGYREAVDVVRGRATEDSARRDIVVATMQYSKRQRTWFRHQETATWCADVEAGLRQAALWREESAERRR
jgi:tRNA dimethylallyltransferase